MSTAQVSPVAPADPFALLAGLPLEDGRLWGDRAQPWQQADARAFFDRSDRAPRRHFDLRARGMSKTTDAAGLGLAALLCEAPNRSRSHLFAVDADQAGILMDSLGGFVQRGGLGSLVELTGRSATNRQTGASLVVESSDGASAYGLRPWLTIVDEMGLWPSTPNHRALWAAITSAVPKVPGSRLLCIGTAGSPASLGAEVWGAAETSPFWRTSRHPGPAPWWTAEDVQATQASLTASEYRRLILCEWAEGDDALTSAEDVAACVRAGEVTLPPRIGRQYVAALDIATRRDLSALAIGHAESRAAGRVVVIDRILYWRPGKGIESRVDLSEVEAAVQRVCAEYNVERLRFDRMQAEQLIGNVSRAGVKVQEYVFSTAGASRLARGLHIALRDRAVELPDDPELIAEAQTVRMVEKAPGMVKMTNPPGTHDDLLVVVGMIVADLTDRPEMGGGGFSVPGKMLAEMRAREAAAGGPGMAPSFLNPAYAQARRGGVGAAISAAQREQTPAQRAYGIGLPVEGTANDPSRVRRR